MIKVKQQRTADCVVGGFRYATKKHEVGSLLLGLYDDEGLLDHVGFTSAIPAQERPALTEKLEGLIQPPGFTGSAPGGPSRWNTERSMAWEPLKPELVVEVRYDQVTGAPLPPRHRLPALAARQGPQANAPSSSSRPSFARRNSRSCSARDEARRGRSVQGAADRRPRVSRGFRSAKPSTMRWSPIFARPTSPRSASTAGSAIARPPRFGWRYDFDDASFAPAEPIPEWLLPLRARAAAFARVVPDDFAHVLLARYDPGAGIGWHRDRPQFEHVVGISLGSPATMRFRQRTPSASVAPLSHLEPRSAYLLSGEVRHEWEHSIAPGDTLRFSITFRTLSERGRKLAAAR